MGTSRAEATKLHNMRNTASSLDHFRDALGLAFVAYSVRTLNGWEVSVRK